MSDYGYDDLYDIDEILAGHNQQLFEAVQQMLAPVLELQGRVQKADGREKALEILKTCSDLGDFDPDEALELAESVFQMAQQSGQELHASPAEVLRAAAGFIVEERQTIDDGTTRVRAEIDALQKDLGPLNADAVHARAENFFSDYKAAGLSDEEAARASIKLAAEQLASPLAAAGTEQPSGPATQTDEVAWSRKFIAEPKPQSTEDTAAELRAVAEHPRSFFRAQAERQLEVLDRRGGDEMSVAHAHVTTPRTEPSTEEGSQ